MKLDENQEAINLLNNTKGSIENRMRSLYNLGYWQGFNDGQREAVRMLEQTLLDMADRKTENSSEKPNNSTCSKMEQVDKDINVRSKDEPQTHDLHTNTHECVKINADQHVQRIEYVENVKRCRKCKHIESEHQTPTASDGEYYTYVVCMASECNYEPKDEPTTQTETQNSNLTFEKADEPQTDCAWK